MARERKGQLAQARLEYTTYLAEFPDGPDAERVQQRLAGLAADEPRRVARDEARSAVAVVGGSRRCGAVRAAYELELLGHAARAPSTHISRRI